MSLVATFDDLMRCAAVLSDGEAEEEFLKFVKVQEESRMQWLAAIQEAQRLQRELDASLQNMADLEAKLYHARKLIEAEHKARKDADHERENIEKKIIAIAELLRNERDIKDETKDKFAFLSTLPRKRKSDNTRAKEKYGNEINSTGSFLSDLSLTQSEDDFLEGGRATKTLKRNRPSYSKANGSYVAGKRSRSTGRRSKSKAMEIGATDKIIAQTKVSIPKEGKGPIQAESTIQAIPQVSRADNLNDDFTARSSTRSTVKTPKRKSPAKSPSKPSFTPSAPTLQEINTPLHEFRKNFGRIHNFSAKTFLKSDSCSHCQKKIRFGSMALKCRDCRLCIHFDCREFLTKPCIPQSGGGTPTLKGSLKNYAPNIPPMIPPIVVHCVHEIETRGLNEIGIYRVSASEKEVKSLKEKFLRGKSVPALGNIDIHVLCGCLKDFLRALQEPLIPTSLWMDFTNAVQNPTHDTIPRDLYKAIEKLPQPNRDTLAFLLLHLKRVAVSEETKMPIENLARIFGPTIVGYSSADPDQHAIFTETMIQYTVMEALLNIPTDYWSQYVQIESDQTEDFNVDARSYYGSPFKGSSMRKQGKYYETPPFIQKRK